MSSTDSVQFSTKWVELICCKYGEPMLGVVSTGERPSNTNTCQPTFYLFAHKITLSLPSQKTERKKEETESKRMYSGWPTHPSVNLLLKPGGGGELVMAEKIYGN